MKAKHALILLALGFIFDLTGAWMKMAHWRNADIVFLTGLVLKIVAVIILTFKIVSYPGWKGFWNR
jgi:hypothetical protein